MSADRLGIRRQQSDNISITIWFCQLSRLCKQLWKPQEWETWEPHHPFLVGWSACCPDDHHNAMMIIVAASWSAWCPDHHHNSMMISSMPWSSSKYHDDILYAMMIIELQILKANICATGVALLELTPFLIYWSLVAVQLSAVLLSFNLLLELLNS